VRSTKDALNAFYGPVAIRTRTTKKKQRIKLGKLYSRSKPVDTGGWGGGPTELAREKARKSSSRPVSNIKSQGGIKIGKDIREKQGWNLHSIELPLES